MTHDNKGDNALTRDDERFAERAGQRLRDSADSLDAATRSRLNQARQRALDEMPGARPDHRQWWMPIGVAAATTAVAIGVWQLSGTDVEPTTAATPIQILTDDAAQLEILLDESQLDMLEDLEFFAWLDDAELETSG